MKMINYFEKGFVKQAQSKGFTKEAAEKLKELQRNKREIDYLLLTPSDFMNVRTWAPKGWKEDYIFGYRVISNPAVSESSIIMK